MYTKRGGWIIVCVSLLIEEVLYSFPVPFSLFKYFLSDSGASQIEGFQILVYI